MIYMCIYNEAEKLIEYKEEYPNPLDIKDSVERESARMLVEQNANRLYLETVGRNGASVDSEGRNYTTGPWQFYQDAEKQFSFTPLKK
jgi:hypothetical protein